MLQVPAFAQINGVTIFADDALFYKFYPIAASPSICLDKNGRPVFLLVKYAISDEDRLAKPNLPAGGGYVNFDVQFDVSEADLTEISKILQPGVESTWNRLKNGTAQEKALPGVAGTTQAPKVEFGIPAWSGGKSAMDAPQSDELVQARVSEAEPSALTANVAVFSMTLTPAGASFMQRTMVRPSGSGIDLTPIQVTYDLKFWARLPAVRIQVKADSQKIHQYIKKVMDGKGVDQCTTYDFQHTDISEDTVKTSGAIDVQIDTGSGALPNEVIEELRKYSLELVKQMIQSTFFSSNPPAPSASADPPVDDGSDSTNPKKYFKKDYSSSEMHIDFNLEQRSVVEWAVHPQATLETFFRGMSADEIKQYVREIDLDDDAFKNLQLTVRAFTDFSDPNVAFVEVQVRYEGTDENGQEREKNQTFTFTSADPQKWSVSLIGSQREYQYRYRVGFKGRDAGPFSDWARAKTPELNIVVPSPGKIDLAVLAGDVDFDTLVQQVQVHIAYEDTELGVGREESVVLLNASRQEDHYQRSILAPRRKPFQYYTRFRLKSGDVREVPDDDRPLSSNGPQIVINQPYEDVLRVSLLPAGDGWDDIINTSVELKYEDMPNHYTVQDALPLKGKDEFKTWKVYLRDRNLRDFKYRWQTSYKSGHLEDSGWKSGSGSGTYPITVKRQGFKIVMLADVLDFNVSPLTEVHLHYKSAEVELQETFTFRDKAPQTWSIDVPQGAPLEYTYEVTHSPAGGNNVTLPEATEHDAVLVIPRYKPADRPEPGKFSVPVFATLIDFATTPIVTLDLVYDDEANNVHAVGALTFTDNKPQIWEVNVKDTNAKRFSYVVTYFTADGVAHALPALGQEAPRIIIPKYKP